MAIEPSTTITYFLEEVPLAGAATIGDGEVSDIEQTVSLCVQFDPNARAATITQADPSGGSMTCRGMTIDSSMIGGPQVMRLPSPADIPIDVLETEACRQELQALK